METTIEMGGDAASPVTVELRPWLTLRHMTRASVVLVSLILFVAAGVNIGAFSVMASQRAQTLAHAKRDIRNLAALLARQADRTFQAVDVVQRNLVDRIQGFGLNDRFVLQAAGRERFVHDMLARDASGLEFVNWISLVDDRGAMVSTSRSYPAPTFDLGNRDYFKALSTEGAPETYVSEPIPNRDNGRPTIYIARRLSDTRGRFLGVLIAGIEAAYFQDLYRGIDIDATRDILLMRNDGVVLSSRIADAGGAAKDPAGAGRYRRAIAISADGRSAEDLEIRDSEQVTAATLDVEPVMVVIRNDTAIVLEEWWNETMFVAFMVLAVDLSVLGAGYVGLRQLRQSRRIGEAERYSARHDILTRLPNRACFQETLDEALATADDVGFGLALIDLDNFKEVNDSQGHQAGDELLKQVSDRLGTCLGADDVLFRLGGDEFAIIQRGIAGRCDLERLAGAALAAFEAPFRIRGRRHAVGASIGIALGNTAEDGELLFDQADMALYQAKALGRGTIRFFSAELQAAKVDRKTLAADLEEAVREETLELHFQPIVDLRSCRLTGFEALLRWDDPVRGSVPPSTFIPIAEETGAIGPLGRWVLREACRQAASWSGRLSVAVNLSAAQMQLQDVAAEVEAALSDAALPPGRLEIEVTETVLLDHAAAASTLHRLVALGVSVSLDDFGTGYSSLSYLRSFPFGRIKIDRSFVGGIVHDREAAAIVQTIRDLGNRLGTAVTAEGIETHAQLLLLQEMGCDSGQGYLLGRPMPARDVPDFIETFSAVSLGRHEPSGSELRSSNVA